MSHSDHLPDTFSPSRRSSSASASSRSESSRRAFSGTCFAASPMISRLRTNAHPAAARHGLGPERIIAGYRDGLAALCERVL